MTSNVLSQLTQAQRDRLAYLELRLRFVGEIGRQDLIQRFGIQTAAATRDLATYRELAGNNLAYDRSSKIYTPTKEFRPIFTFSADRVLAWLAEGFGDGEPASSAPGISCVTSGCLTQPDLDTLGMVTRAIYHRCPLRVEYYSLASGKTHRDSPVCADRYGVALACTWLRSQARCISGLRDYPHQATKAADGIPRRRTRAPRTGCPVESDIGGRTGAAPRPASSRHHCHGLRHERWCVAFEATWSHGWLRTAQMEHRLLTGPPPT